MQKPQALVEGKDFYIDEKTGYLVFTKDYLLARGACCKSGCRHCPYGYIAAVDEKVNKTK